MAKLSDSAFEETKKLEIELRGEYLRFSAKIEGLITKYIILLNEIRIKNTGLVEEINFNNFTFYKKEEKFKTLLDSVYPDLLQLNLALFDHFSKFRDIRNKMAHCYFTWNENDLSFVTIWDVEDKNIRPHKVVDTAYKIKDIKSKLAISKLEITLKLNELAREVEKRALHLIPEMF